MRRRSIAEQSENVACKDLAGVTVIIAASLFLHFAYLAWAVPPQERQRADGCSCPSGGLWETSQGKRRNAAIAKGEEANVAHAQCFRIGLEIVCTTRPESGRVARPLSGLNVESMCLDIECESNHS